MAWSIVDSDPRCDGYAVVKDTDGTVEGCHRTREAALRQLAALYYSEQRAHRRPNMIRFISDQVTVTAAAGDAGEGSRRIDAIAVPYHTYATVSDGTVVRFAPGSLPVDGKAPRVFMYHDATMPVGIVAERVDTEDAMLASMKISRTRLGDDALALAADGVMDVSVGVNAIRSTVDDQGRVTITEAEWVELSLVPIPAFAGSVVTDVAATGNVNTVTSTGATNPGTTDTTATEETPTVEATPAPQAETIEAAAVIPTAPIPAQPKREFRMPSAAEYLAAYHQGGDTFRKVNAAFVEAQKSRMSALEAAAGDVTVGAGDVDGLLPVPVVAPVFDDLNYVRPVVAAVGARAMPDGGNSRTFIRPTWTTHPGVASQANELTAVNAVTPVIADNVVSKTTLAGQVTLSVQSMDFTSPGAMQIILQDLASQYLIASDNFCADEIVSQGGASGVTWTFNATDPSDLIDSLYEVAESQLAATGFLPDTLFVSADIWRKLSRQLDADKRPIFPYAGAAGLMGVNGLGTQNITTANTLNPLGLNLVADRNFASGTMVLARANAVEFYEQVRGIMSREDASTLGRTFSYYGYVAAFVADATMVSKITCN